MIRFVSDSKKRDERGFTLIELLVVIVILGIISAVVVFSVQGLGGRGEEEAAAIDARTIRTAEEAFCAQNGRYAGVDELVKAGLIDSPPTLNQPAVFAAGYPGMPVGGACGPSNGTDYATSLAICGAGGCGQTSPASPSYKAVGSVNPVDFGGLGRYFGDKMMEVGADISAVPDGVNDVWVRSGNTTSAVIYALSGAALAAGDVVIEYTITYAAAGNNQMTEMTSLSDINADGVADLALGRAFGEVPVSVHDGKTGSRIFGLTRPASFGGGFFKQFGEVGSAGDVNADGRTDIGVSDSAVNKVAIYSGNDGSVLRVIDNPDAACNTPGCFGSSVQSPGDVDGDGVWDLLVGGSGRMFLLGGVDGSVLLNIGRPPLPDGSIYSPAFQSFGGSGVDVAPNSPGDLSGDGKSEIYAAAMQEAGPAGTCEGRAWVFDGGASIASGTDAATRVPVVKYMLTDPALSRQKNFGKSMASADVNGDGIKDLLVGSNTENPCGVPVEGGPDRNGGTALFDGATGQVLTVSPVPEEFRQPYPNPPCVVSASGSVDFPVTMGRSVAAPGDLNGDGKEDLIAGGRGFDTKCDATSVRRDQGLLLTYLSGPSS